MLDDYAWQWLDTRLTRKGERLRPKTRQLYEGCLRLHILPTLGTAPLARLTTSGIRSWHAGLLTEGFGASSVAKCYRFLPTILNTGVELADERPAHPRASGGAGARDRSAPRRVDATRARLPGVRRTSRRTLRIATWKREWTRVRRALDLEGVRLHDLRHLAGTMAAATGASTKELMHRLGHASPRAALPYQHATAERDEAIADGIDRILEASQRDGDHDTNVIRFRRAAE